MNFDQDYQKALVGKLCSKSFMEPTGCLLRPDMFDPEFRGIIDQVSTRWRNKKQTLTSAQLRQLCHQEGVKGVTCTQGGSDFDHEVVMRFARNRIFADAMAKAAVLNEQGRTVAAVETVRSCASKFPAAQSIESVDILQSRRPIPKRVNLAPTGIELLDEKLGGGVGGGEIGVVMAPTSGGKTTFLCHLAAHAVTLGLKVYFLTLDLPAVSVEQKMRFRLTGKVNPSRKVWEALSKKLRRKKGRCQVVERPARSIGPSEMDQEIPSDTDLIIVDYADYLLSPRGMGLEYVDLGETYNSLKAMGMMRKTPIWTASQVNRGAYKSFDIGTDDVEASLRKMMTCNIAVALIEEKEECVNGKAPITLRIAKNTFGERFVNLSMIVDWKTSTFREE